MTKTEECVVRAAMQWKRKLDGMGWAPWRGSISTPLYKACAAHAKAKGKGKK